MVFQMWIWFNLMTVFILKAEFCLMLFVQKQVSSTVWDCRCVLAMSVKGQLLKATATYRNSASFT